jgi:hypothetical protein
MNNCKLNDELTEKRKKERKRKRGMEKRKGTGGAWE